jgi:hypothetical protein
MGGGIMLLHDFLTANHDELIARCETKVAKRPPPRPDAGTLKHGIPRFLKQLGNALREEQTPESSEVHKSSGPSEVGKHKARSEIAKTAALHGDELLEQGFTVDQVVHDYGDLCQAVTELAIEKSAPISNEEFHMLNLCLDNAIAGAVTEYNCQHDQAAFNAGTTGERPAVEYKLRNLVGAAILALESMQHGRVGVSGATGAVLSRNLITMRDLIDDLLAEEVAKRGEDSAKSTA